MHRLENDMTFRRLRFLPVFALVAALLYAGGASAASKTVTMTRDEAKNPESGWVFVPAATTVNVGDTVVWKNTSQAPHTATSDDDGVFSSGNIAPGADFSFTFDTAGTFSYFCEYHSGQVGKITVMAAASGGDDGSGDGQGDGTDDGSGDGTDDGSDDGANMPDETPNTGAGGLAGGAAAPLAPIGAALSLFAMTAWSTIRRRR